MKPILQVFTLILFFTQTVLSQIITVKQDSTGDYTTIQAAVDASVNGDTVLVWPGTYYENVVIEEKNITLGGLTLTKGDVGYINQTKHTAEFSPFYRVPDLPGQPAPAPGEYTLRLLDTQGATLASYPLPASTLHCLEANEDEMAIFGEVVPWVQGTARIELMHGTDVLAARTVSSHTPTVSIIYPQGGETLHGEAQIKWTAEDADGNDLSYTIFYSADDGQTWRVVASDWTTSTMTLDANSLPGSDRARLRVLVSDGVNTGQADSAVFRIPPNAPKPVILKPGDGKDYGLDQVLDLMGSAWDEEDGNLDDTSLTWTDDVSGVLGTGATLYAVTLTPGYHTITLTATDSDGLSASDSVSIYIGYRTWLPVLYR